MIKAVVFDKDGTLVDFVRFWYPVARRATEIAFDDAGVPHSRINAHLERLGLTRDAVDINGALARGDHKGIIDEIFRDMRDSGCNSDWNEALRLMIKGYGKESKLMGEVAPTTEGMRAVLLRLKEMGIMLAMITSDEINGAKICLEKLGVADLFGEIIAADSHHPTKPDPYLMNEFLRRNSLSASEVIMVGDTETDILFAKNSGVFSVGVGTSVANRAILSEIGADVTVRDVSGIPLLIEEKFNTK